MDEKGLIIVIGELVTHLVASDVLPKRLGNKIHKAIGVKPSAKRKPTADIGVGEASTVVPTCNPEGA